MENQPPPEPQESDNFTQGSAQAPQPEIFSTSNEKADGLNKCPTCGSSEITYSLTQEALVCDYCKNSWNEPLAIEAFGLESDIGGLSGIIMGSGSQDIIAGNDVVTIKCQGCGAEIVLQTSESVQARCHWCRQTLSLSTQIPNGVIPDAILPFTLQKAKAVESIRQFVDARKTFALKKFKEEFTPENVVGVYMPYMVVDANMTAEFRGRGEVQTKKYTRTDSNGDSETYYDADEYLVQRGLSAHIDDLTTESSSDRADFHATDLNTNNVINAILPFSTKDALVYNSNYVGAFTSEKRDLSVSEVIDGQVSNQLLSIARSQTTDLIQQYDRGVRWEHEAITIHGSRWMTMYLPVWLYSYYTPNSNGQGGMAHYIAVNGRTGKTMGSIPVNKALITAVAVAAGVATAIPTYGLVLGGVLL